MKIQAEWESTRQLRDKVEKTPCAAILHGRFGFDQWDNELEERLELFGTSLCVFQVMGGVLNNANQFFDEGHLSFLTLFLFFSLTFQAFITRTPRFFSLVWIMLERPPCFTCLKRTECRFTFPHCTLTRTN